MNDTTGKMTYINVDETNETLHLLWSTPVVMAKPFDDDFLRQLREDTKYLLEPGAPGTFNHTDLWQLPNLPPTFQVVLSTESNFNFFNHGVEVKPSPCILALFLWAWLINQFNISGLFLIFFPSSIK